MTDQERVIQIVGMVDGSTTGFDGQYLVEFDPGRDGVEPMSGRTMPCHLVTTSNVEEATRYGPGEAMEVWQSVDPRRPTRLDGRPNRPLTAFTVIVGAPGSDIFDKVFRHVPGPRQ